MASQRLGLPCHSLSAPRVPTPILCKTVHFAAVPLRRILFHCCAFALLFLARPLPCHSDLRPSDAPPRFAMAIQVRSMPFCGISELCSSISSLGNALLHFAVASLCSANPLLGQSMPSMPFRYNSLHYNTIQRDTIASLSAALPSPVDSSLCPCRSVRLCAMPFHCLSTHRITFAQPL